MAVESDGNGFGNPVGGVGSYRNPPATPLSVVVVDPLVTLGDKNVKTPTEDTAQAEVCRLLSGILITLLRWTNATRDQVKEEREMGVGSETVALTRMTSCPTVGSEVL